METHFFALDWIVLVAYFFGTMSIGFYFYYQNKSRSMEGFTVASRSLPGWVCGLSIFATFLSSISFWLCQERRFQLIGIRLSSVFRFRWRLGSR